MAHAQARDLVADREPAPAGDPGPTLTELVVARCKACGCQFMHCPEVSKDEGRNPGLDLNRVKKVAKQHGRRCNGDRRWREIWSQCGFAVARL